MLKHAHPVFRQSSHSPTPALPTADAFWCTQPFPHQYFTFNTDISSRLLFMLLSICYWHKQGDIMWIPFLVSIKNYSWAQIWITLRGGAAERADISPTNTQIDSRVTEPTVIWLTSDTIKWEREGTEDHHYINHLSFPRLPLWIICAHHLMGFVCSQTNFAVNITIMPPEFAPTQTDDDRETKRKSRDAGGDNNKHKGRD